MNVFCLIVTSIVLCVSANAQVSLTKSFNEPILGDVNAKQLYDSSGVIPKTFGANQLWDFSNLTLTSNIEISNFISTSAAGGPSYPGATIVESYGSTKFYMKTTASQYEIVAIQNSNFNLDISSNTAIQYMWPITFGYSKTDAFSGTATANNMNGNVTGSILSSAPGTGTLILPNGTIFSNVLQVKISLTAQASFLLGLTTVNLKVIDYMYYDANNKFPLLGIRYTDASGAYTSKTVDIIVNSDLVGINDLNFDTQFNIFPNPTSDIVNIKLSNSKNDDCKLEIFDMSGQLIEVYNFGKGSEIFENISLSKFSSGLYVIKTTLGEKSSFRKLIVK